MRHQILITTEDTEETVKAKILQVKDHLIRDMLVQGCAIIFPTENKPAKGHNAPESVQNRINYIAGRLALLPAPYQEWIRMVHYAWLASGFADRDL